MIRAIIGTIAVLAGFAVVEQTVDASTGHAGSCTPTQAYALLPRYEAAPVRSEPTPEGPVIGTLAGHRIGSGDHARASVTIMGSQSGWARIALGTARAYFAADGTALSFGWIPADLLTVDARVDGVITLYSKPGFLGRALATIEGDDMKFRVLGCRGDFLQVINARHGSVWIDRWCAREAGCRA